MLFWYDEQKLKGNTNPLLSLYKYIHEYIYIYIFKFYIIVKYIAYIQSHENTVTSAGAWTVNIFSEKAKEI
jgi:hypothetical protein